MIKALGQNGLNFITNKYKELKALVDKKVDKVSGKGLSTNDYDATAKSKVDAIPVDPKYTDTTYDLSKYAEKSDISRCKTKGYDTSSTWQALGTSRDLEDWIGDFDKRTRELKNSGSGGDFRNITVPDNSKIVGILNYRYFRVYKIGGLVCINTSIDLESLLKIQLPTGFRPNQSILFNVYVDLLRPSTKVPYEENHSIPLEIDTTGSISSRFQTIDNAIGKFNIVFAIGN